MVKQEGEALWPLDVAVNPSDTGHQDPLLDSWERQPKQKHDDQACSLGNGEGHLPQSGSEQRASGDPPLERSNAFHYREEGARLGSQQGPESKRRTKPGKCMNEACPSGEGDSDQEETGAIHKTYLCHCGKCCRWRSNLRAHEVIHAGGKPQRCSVYQSSCNNGSNLMHARILTGEKSYKCLKCGGNFLQGRSFAAHEEIHIQEKPHHCFIRGEDFRRSTKLSSTGAGRKNMTWCTLFTGKTTGAATEEQAVLAQTFIPTTMAKAVLQGDFAGEAQVQEGDLGEINLVRLSPTTQDILQQEKEEQELDYSDAIPSSPIALPAAQPQVTPIQGSRSGCGFSMQVVTGEEEHMEAERHPPDSTPCAGSGRRPGGAPRTLEVWKYFRQMDNPWRGQCLLCRRQISRRKVMGQLTNSGMMHHLRKHHELVLRQGEVGKGRPRGFPSRSALKNNGDRKAKGSQKAPS
ncbi:zinc finger and SCAN domain-containing protein 12-like isoform X1 [Rhineura floridana]|uniref:zinc finger and SCAN domain-containing protein 12-like isoform X1 n=1 Tax=Rhineura floridana TaxID=261503 RepID=UPI002AC86671|nr:zinc finger and SCAN domain-containing protein 12-like isoform X1 [Rhineura floridana]XP_061475752.1 zinc finger and SCAN domain-containing protein 12-like isoform X1 [Rhineura floridana]